jgi:hypothetical protein
VTDEPRRNTTTVTKTEVWYVAKPFGRNRENPPSLADLRAFVAKAEGLPDDVMVRIESGQLDEGGRRFVTLSCTYTHPAEDGAP